MHSEIVRRFCKEVGTSCRNEGIRLYPDGTEVKIAEMGTISFVRGCYMYSEMSSTYGMGSDKRHMSMIAERFPDKKLLIGSK